MLVLLFKGRTLKTAGRVGETAADDSDCGESFPTAAAQLALFTNGLSKYNSGKSQNSRKELLAWVEIQISASGAAARARLCTQMAL